jgi:hypothetical protein
LSPFFSPLSRQILDCPFSSSHCLVRFLIVPFLLATVSSDSWLSLFFSPLSRQILDCPFSSSHCLVRFLIVPFLLATVSSIIRFTVLDGLFGIFKYFFTSKGLITVFVTSNTTGAHMEQELLTFSEHLSSLLVFSDVCVAKEYWSSTNRFYLTI